MRGDMNGRSRPLGPSPTRDLLEGGQGIARGFDSVLVRQSRVEPQVLLLPKAEATKRWTCAVAKRLADSGFLMTAYPTDAIKEGVRIWRK